MLKSASFLFAFSSNHYTVPRSDTILRYDTLRYIFKTSIKNIIDYWYKVRSFQAPKYLSYPCGFPKHWADWRCFMSHTGSKVNWVGYESVGMFFRWKLAVIW